MRLFLSFALALGLALVAAAAMAPAVQTLLAPIHVVPLHRIFGRLAMVALQGTTIWLLIRHGLATREVLGYAVPPRDFARQVLIGLIASIALMLLVLVPLFVLGIRAWDHRLPDDFPGRVVLGLKALQTGLVVALIEETFYRGAMQGSISLIGSARTAVLLVPILYSAIHFFGGAAHIPYAAVTPGSGFTMLAESLRMFTNPQQIADAFLALYVVGVLLALIRYYSGNIAGCIGLHAGIVAEMTVVRRNSSPVPDFQWTFMVSRFDHTLGIWAMVVALAACWVVWTIGSRGKASSKAR